MWLKVHLLSISVGFGAAATLTFLLFTTAILFFVSHKHSYIYYLLLQAAFLPYLTGLAVYVSGGEDAWVLFWFRVCVAGLILPPLALEFFLGSLVNRQSPVRQLFIGLSGLMLLLVLLIRPDLIASGEISIHPLGFYSVDKGPLFPFVAAYSALCPLFSMGLFIRTVLAVKGLWKRYSMILSGLAVWIAAMLVEALISFRIVSFYSVSWTGPVVMVLAIGLHMGLEVDRSFRTSKAKMRENKILRQKLKFDPLTGLYTRDFFNTILEVEADAWARKPQENSILFIDADNFKGINDRYSHAGGDRVLTLIGEIVGENVRRSDLPARYGGDEFIILLRNCTRDSARILGEKIIGDYRRRLHEEYPDMPEGFTGLSIGISSSSFWESGRRDLVALADEAMYCSKRHGKNQVVVAEAG